MGCASRADGRRQTVVSQQLSRSFRNRMHVIRFIRNFVGSFCFTSLAVVENRNAQHAIQICCLRSFHDSVKDILWWSRRRNIVCYLVVIRQMNIHGRNYVIQDLDDNLSDIGASRSVLNCRLANKLNRQHREFLDQIHIELSQRRSSKIDRGSQRPSDVEVQQSQVATSEKQRWMVICVVPLRNLNSNEHYIRCKGHYVRQNQNFHKG